MENIKLININLEGISKSEEIAKFLEEKNEFLQALDECDMIHAIEEYWDLVQAGLGVLDKFGVDANTVMLHYPDHLKKLENRPRR